MPDSPTAPRTRTPRALILPATALLWAAAIVWMAADAGAACASGGCGPAELIAQTHQLFVPVLLGGPVAMLATGVALSPPGKRYRPAWYLLVVIWFCVPPGLLLDAIASTIAHTNSPEPLSDADRTAATLKLTVAGAAAVLAPAALAVVTYRRGYQTYARVLGAVTIATAVWFTVQACSPPV